MVERVQIILDAQDEASAELKGVTKQLGALGDEAKGASKKASVSFTEMRSVYLGFLEAVRLGKEVFDATVGATVELANSVRQFRDVTGQTAEESSRLIQVLDDYKVSVGDAEKATKTLSKDGLELNIQTIAQLSDEFLALGSDVERTQFLYDKFGKSGENFAEVMRQGSKAILEANDAISENLILSDKQLKAARDYEKMLDETNDTLLGLKVSLGNKLLPVSQDFLQVMQAQINKGFEWQDAIAPLAFIQNIKMLSDAMKDNTTAAMEADTARWDGIASMYATVTATEDMTGAAEDFNAANQEFLSVLGNMQSAETSYQDKVKSLTEERMKLEEEKQKLLRQGWWEESEKIQDINAKIDENTQKAQDNATEHDLANKKIILGLLERKLTQDGILTDDELTWLLEKGVAWGIYSQTVVDETAKAIEEANNLALTLANMPTEGTFTYYINQVGGGVVQTASNANQFERRHADGGMFTIPAGYGNEGFRMGGRDTASAGEMVRITPRGQDPNASIIEAIYATQTDYNELTRAFIAAVQQGLK